MAVQAECACRIVDRYETLPLLDRKRLRRIDTQADGLALRVECVKVDMCNDPKRCLSAI